MRYKIHKQYRLPEYDYSQGGMYFITICTKGKIKYFGNIINEKMILNNIGAIVNKFWLEIPQHFKDIFLDEYIIMPDHLHGIIFIDKDIPAKINNDVNPVGTGQCPVPTRQYPPSGTGTGQCPVPTRQYPPSGTGQCPVPTRQYPPSREYSTFGHVLPQSISTIIGSFKSICTKTINKKYPNLGFEWQTRFYDRVIHTERSLNNTRNYIYNNPLRFTLDHDNDLL